MSVLLLPLIAIAACGFSLSAVLHLCALAGQAPAWLLPLVDTYSGALTLGIFVVWVPAVLLSQYMQIKRQEQFSWNSSLAGCPRWMRYAVGGLFIYAFGNFFLSVRHAETELFGAMRTFSGHWMLFYGVAFTIFYSIWRRPQLMRPQLCPLGHHVGHHDHFCPECGTRIPPAPPGLT